MDYLDEITNAIQKISKGDFSAKVNIRGNDDRFDSIANGINMLAEEIKALFDERINYEANLHHKIKDLKGTVDFTRDTEIRIINMMEEVDELRKKLKMSPKYFFNEKNL